MSDGAELKIVVVDGSGPAGAPGAGALTPTPAGVGAANLGGAAGSLSGPLVDVLKQLAEVLKRLEEGFKPPKVEEEKSSWPGRLKAAADALGLFAGGLKLATQQMAIENEFRAGMIRGENQLALDVQRSLATWGNAAGWARWGGTVVGAGLAATGAGLPAAGFAVAGGQVIGGAIDAAGGYFNSEDKMFLERWKAIAGRSEQLGRYGGQLGGALARARGDQVGRDIAESRLLGPTLARFTDAEREFFATQQQFQALQRWGDTVRDEKKLRQEQADLQKRLNEQLEKLPANIADEIRKIGRGNESPLQELLKGLAIPGDSLPADERALQKLADQLLNRPVFPGA